MTEHPGRLWRTAEAARAVGVSPATLRRWARAGQVTPALRTAGGQDRWNLATLRDEIRSLQEERDVEPAGTPERQPVVAAIVTSEHGVLAGRRNDGRPPWTFIAGEIEPGESSADAAVREVKEETGLTVLAGDREIGRRVHPHTGRTMIYLACAPTGSTNAIVGDEDELAEVRWLSLPEVDDLLPGLFAPVRDYLHRTIG